MKTNKENWEEQFNKQFPDGSYEDMIKTFIRSNFISKEELFKKLGEMRKDEGGRQSREQADTWYENNPYNERYNDALDEVLNLLEETNDGK